MILLKSLSRTCIALLLGASASTAAAAKDPIPSEVERVAREAITRGAIEAPIRFLADDALEGRAPGARGDELARLFLVSQLQALGYEPGGPGGQWQQPEEIVSMKAHMPRTWTFAAKNRNIDLRLQEDFVAVSGVQREKSAIRDAEVVLSVTASRPRSTDGATSKGSTSKGRSS